MNLICFLRGHDCINCICQRCGNISAISEGYIEDFARSHGYIKPVAKVEHPRDERARLFPVAGAGYIAISSDPHQMTGQTIGFSFEASWGAHGYVGGVIGRTQALEMAKFILNACEGITETEIQEWFRVKEEHNKRMNELANMVDKTAQQ
jgi:hypothetical protein